MRLEPLPSRSFSDASPIDSQVIISNHDALVEETGIRDAFSKRKQSKIPRLPFFFFFSTRRIQARAPNLRIDDNEPIHQRFKNTSEKGTVIANNIKKKKKTKIKCRLSLNPLRANDRNFARNLSSVFSPLQPLPPPVLKAKTLLPLRRLRRRFYFSGTCRCEAEMTLFSTRVTGYSSTATFCYIAIFLLFALPPEGSSQPLTIRHFRGGGARASQILGNLLPVAR